MLRRSDARIPSPRARGEGHVSPLSESVARRQPTVRGRFRKSLSRSRPLTIGTARPIHDKLPGALYPQVGRGGAPSGSQPRSTGIG
ncbi:hypothetical protein DK427_25300 [Methylobacterium radiodurans]|uniref:Uncharacterized protein n=1 Tax=Methylobacterium radiodurans TaxID=2202828 RepID=A0A2U8VXX6_9HYPH|nr:hypothetical protein DK427_25300 [Methylobacterium radiodurans]